MPQISVIVPVYNMEKFLEKCLESIVNQSFKDFELIIVNDGSTDCSQQIIDRYTSNYPFIKSYFQNNSGQGAARNLGIEKSSGKYLSFIDSDDYIEVNMLRDMHEKAETENADIVICDMRDIFSDGTPDIYHDCVHYDNVLKIAGSACNKLFRKSLIEDLRFPAGRWYEDFYFTACLLFSEPIVAGISKDYYVCNCGHVSTMNNNNSVKNLDMLYVLDSIRDYTKSKGTYDDNKFSFLVFRHVLITTINRVSKQNNRSKKTVISELRNYCKKNIPEYKSMPFYKEITLNRKIIAFLNYNHMHQLSKLILNLKSEFSF